MTVRMESEQQILNEAMDILFEHMSPAKVARVLAAWQVGSGNYLQWRDDLFAGETVERLAPKIEAF